MTTQLITDWATHDVALSDILGRATQSIDIFDHDLTRLPLERPTAIEELIGFLTSGENARLRIVLRDPAYFRNRCPRLLKLLATMSHKMSVTACPEHLINLNDSLFLVDGRHGLIRFHQDNVRSKRIDDDADECRNYVQRFAEILKEEGEAITPTPLGL